GSFPTPPLRIKNFTATASLLDQLPFLITAAVGSFLVHLCAGRRAAAGVGEHQSAVEVEEGDAAVAVGDRLPLIVTRGAEGPLDDLGAGGSGSALDDGVPAALGTVDLIVAAGSGDKVQSRFELVLLVHWVIAEPL